MLQNKVIHIILLVGMYGFVWLTCPCYAHQKHHTHLISIQSPQYGEEITFEPVTVVIQLERDADPASFKAWLNKKEITQEFTFDAHCRRMTCVVGPELGLRITGEMKNHGRKMSLHNNICARVNRLNTSCSMKNHEIISRPFSVTSRGLTRKTRFGLVRGKEDSSGVWVWNAVPFALPPQGDLRWKPPQDPVQWNGVRDVTGTCPACSQNELPYQKLFTESQFIGSEDCLYLSLYRPKTKEKHLPVYVWIHGGGNFMGKAELYNGSNLASCNNCIVVIVQYRLGPLGWLYHPALHVPGDSLQNSGNFGLLDIIKSLQWVRDNIDAFGGEPANVTIAGESAGAFNVLSLLISPKATGLFHKAIVQSDPTETYSKTKGKNHADGFLKNLLVSDKTVLDTIQAASHLRRMSGDEIRSYLNKKSAKELIIASRYLPAPTVEDGCLIPASIKKMLDSGIYNKVPIILGSTEHEANLFLPRLALATGVLPWIKLIDVLYGTRTLDEVLPGEFDKHLYTVSSYFGSCNWRCLHVDEHAQALSRHQADVYAYLFKWGANSTVGSGTAPFDFVLGAFHGAEIPFFFGYPRCLFNLSFNPEHDFFGRKKLSNYMMRALGNFMRYGTPNRCDTDFLWKQWSHQDGGFSVLELDADSTDLKLHMSTQKITRTSLNSQLNEEIDSWDRVYGPGTKMQWEWVPRMIMREIPFSQE